MSRLFLFFAAGLLAGACLSRAALNADESERIDEVLRPGPASEAAVQGIAVNSAPPLAEGPIATAGYEIRRGAQRSGATRPFRPARRTPVRQRQSLADTPR